MSDELLLQAAAEAERVRDQSLVPAELKSDLELAVQDWLNLEDEIEEAENRLRELKAKRERARISDIPSFMEKLGLVSTDGKGSFKMSDGTKVFLRNEMFVSVVAADKDQAMSYLKNTNNEACIKTDFSSSNLKRLFKELYESGVNPDVDLRSIADPERPLFKRYSLRFAVAQGRPINKAE